MTDNAAADASQSQLDKFEEAARHLEADEDERLWDERLRKVVRSPNETQAHKPDSAQDRE